jgi:spore germination protein KC
MKKQFIPILFICCFLSACNGSEEVDELALITAIGVELAEENEIKLIVQYLKPVKDQEPLPETKEVIGKTIYEASRKLNEFMDRRPFLSHNFVILVSEEMAKTGLRKSLDFFRRDNEMRQDSLVIITKKPSEILNILQKQKQSGATLKYMARENSKRNGMGEISTIHKVYQNLYLRKPYLTITHIVPDDKNTRIDGFSVFNDDKFVTNITGKEAKGWGILTHNKNLPVIISNCPKPNQSNKKITYILSKNHNNIRVFLGKGNKLFVRASINLEAAIAENQCMLDLGDPWIIRKLESDLERDVEKIVSNTVKFAQKKVGLDFFGFGNKLYTTNPNAWKIIERNYESSFNEANIKIQVNAKIVQTGSVYD